MVKIDREQQDYSETNTDAIEKLYSNYCNTFEWALNPLNNSILLTNSFAILNF